MTAMTRRPTAKKTPAKPARATYSGEQRASALDLYREHGPAEASRRCGVPARTISSWAKRSGAQSDAPAKTAAAVEQAALSLEARKQELAGRLLTEIGGLLDQLHQPTTERKVVTLPGKILLQLDEEGEPDLASAWTVAEVRRDRPTVAEQKTIMVTAAIAVDKVQVLTGGATHRVAFEGHADREVEAVAAEIIDLAARRSS